MRILIDENISPIIGDALALAGHDVSAVAVVCSGASDTHVVALASAEARILISEDKDFGDLAMRDGLHPPGLIRLVLPGYDPSAKAARLLQVLAAEGTSAMGAILVVEADRSRLHPLP